MTPIIPNPGAYSKERHRRKVPLMVEQLDTRSPNILPTLLQPGFISRVLQILKEVRPSPFIRHTQRHFLQIFQLRASDTINERVETMRQYL